MHGVHICSINEEKRDFCRFLKISGIALAFSSYPVPSRLLFESLGLEEWTGMRSTHPDLIAPLPRFCPSLVPVYARSNCSSELEVKRAVDQIVLGRIFVV